MAMTGADAADAVEVRQEDGPVMSGEPASSGGVEAAFERLPCCPQDEGAELACGRGDGAPHSACKRTVAGLCDQARIRGEASQQRHARQGTPPTLAGASRCSLVHAPALRQTEGDAEPASTIGLRRLWRAVEHSSAVVVITDASGRIEYVNPSFSEVTGYRLEEIAGRTAGILEPGQTSEGECRELWSTLRRGENWHGELCNRRKDGSLHRGSASISPVKGADGSITHFIAVQVDAGPRRRAEEDLSLDEQRFRLLVETCLPGICIERNGKPLSSIAASPPSSATTSRTTSFGSVR